MRGRIFAGLFVALITLTSAPLAFAASSSPTVGAAASPSGHGYWSVQADGTMSSFGDAKTEPGPGTFAVVGMARDATGHGYWLVSSNGHVAAYGDATSYGSVNGALFRPIVGIAQTPSGHGYWLVASDGGVFSFGDAKYHGGTGGLVLNQPVVGMAPTPTGNGYWLVASDGGVFSYGDARFRGSMGGTRLVQPVVGMAAMPTGSGYRLVARDGGIFDFGNAKFYGSMGGKPINYPVTQIATTSDGNGYWEFAIDGGVFTFGDAKFYGSSPHPIAPPLVDFVFPFQDWTQTAPPSTWTQDQGVDVFLKDRGQDVCGSISNPSTPYGPVLVAVASGTIVGEGISGFGPSAPILHVDQGALAGMYVYYGHSAGDLVPVGAHVRQGDPITHVGCGIVGLSNEPHVEIGMAPYYPGVPPCGSGCHGSSTSSQMLSWLLATYGH